MKFKTLILFVLMTSYSIAVHAQSDKSKSLSDENLYNECLAILHNGQLLVDEFSPRGHCRVDVKESGTLTVPLVEIHSDREVKAKENTAFMVGIKNKRTNTLWMYTKAPVKEIRIEDIISKCQPEDQIVFMTIDQRYNLSHHVIDIEWGNKQ